MLVAVAPPDGGSAQLPSHLATTKVVGSAPASTSDGSQVKTASTVVKTVPAFTIRHHRFTSADGSITEAPRAGCSPAVVLAVTVPEVVTEPNVRLTGA